MQTVSENWAGILSGEHVTNFKMVIAGETYTYADIVSGNIHLSLMETLSLGNAGCGTIEMTFRPRGAIPTMAKIQCFVQISNGTDTIFITGEDGAVIIDHESVPLVSQEEEAGDWLPFGVFYIDTRKTDPFGWMTITGYDAMLMTEQLYLDNDGQYPMPMADAVAFIAGQIGVEVDARCAIADYTIDYPAEIYTLREVLGSIAAASGGSWCISPSGKLWLVPLAAPSTAEETPCGSCDILEGGLVTISRVTLYPDDGTKRTAGNDTGYEITGTCAYATDEMCQALLAKLQGVPYLPLEAREVLIDPALELGDTICVNGNTTILGEIRYTIGKGLLAEIAAPIDSEINHEYPYGQSGSRTERQLAQAYSAITKTTEEIRMEVAAADGRYTELALNMDGLSAEVQGLEGEYAALALTVDGFTITDSSGTTRIKGSSIDTSTLNVDNINIDLTGAIKWTDLSDEVQTEIDTAMGYADDAMTAAEDAQSTVDGWRYNGGTYIDGSMLKTGTVMASKLIGGEVELLTSAERTAGGIEITGASTSTYAVELYSNGALRLGGYNGAVYIEGYGDTYITIDKSGPYSEYSVVTNGDFLPNGSVYLGRSGYEWAGVYLDTDPMITSDANRKHDIEDLPEKYVTMLGLLTPKRFRLNNGTSGRYHVGYLSQDVKAAMDHAGVDSTEFGGWVRDIDAEGNEIYSLRYAEFGPIYAAKLKQIEGRLARLEEANGKS